MKRIELVSLKLENFMGVRSFTLDLDGADATVRATNGAGKTTLATSLSWLITGKDTRGQADFQIKTLEATGEALHNLEHTVEATFRVDGETTTFRRALKEVWTRKRNSPTEEFTGHETLFWIDDVPCGTKREYDEAVADLLPAAAWRELTNPDAWHAQHWQKRRSDLIEICGDVTDEDVIEANPDLADLPEVLGKRTTDDHRKVVAARRKEINAELTLIPARIDEVQHGMPEALDAKPKQLEAALVSAREERQDAAEQLAAARTGAGDVTAERARLREVEDALSDLDRQAARALTEAQDAAAGKVLAARRSLEDATQRLARAEGQVTEYQADLATLDERLQALRDEWATVNARAVEPHVDGTCPACQQALPAEQVEAAHQKATEDLNAQKARELARIKSEGDALRTRRDAKAAELALTEGKIEPLQASIEGFQKALEAAEADAAKATTVKPKKDPTQSPEYARLAAERDELTERISKLSSGDQAEIERLAAEVERLDGLVAGFEADMAKLQQRKAAEARIQELSEQEKKLTSEYEKLERELDLIEKFVRAKSRMLTDRINSHFSMTTFRLFEDQINGGLADVCTALVGGVPYDAGLNRAARINSGLDVINVLQAHHGVRVPILVDEAESVVNLLELDTQVVTLVVDDAHPELHVQLANPTPKKAEVAA